MQVPSIKNRSRAEKAQQVKPLSSSFASRNTDIGRNLEKVEKGLLERMQKKQNGTTARSDDIKTSPH